MASTAAVVRAVESARTRSAWVSKPEQPRPLGPQPRDARGDRAVVVLPGRRPAIDASNTRRRRSRLRSLVSTGWPVGSSSGIRWPSTPAVGGGGRGRGDLLGVEAVELGGVGDPDGGGLGGQLEVLPERRRQRRELLVELGEPGAAGVVELGAGQHEVQVVALDQPHRLVVEARVVPRRRARRRSGRTAPGRGAGRRRARPPAGRSPARSRAAAAWTPTTARLPNTASARDSSRPDRSSATTVFSKVGGSSGADDRGDLGPLLGHAGEQRLPAVLGVMSPNGGSAKGSVRRAAQRVVRGHGGGVDGAHRRPSSVALGRCCSSWLPGLLRATRRHERRPASGRAGTSVAHRLAVLRNVRTDSGTKTSQDRARPRAASTAPGAAATTRPAAAERSCRTARGPPARARTPGSTPRRSAAPAGRSPAARRCSR